MGRFSITKSNFYKRIILPYRGATLIEVILSLAIFLIIIVSFLNMFVFSTATNKKSEEILDATYVAQDILEKRYGESQAGSPLPKEGTFTRSVEGFLVEEIVQREEDGNLVRIVIKVYSEENGKQLEAQMETYLLWNTD